MRRLNSSIKVDFLTDKGADSINRTYFAHIPLEDMVCYVVAESYDDDYNINSAKIAVDAVLVAFERKPSFRNLKHYIRYANDQVRANSVKNKLEVAITVVVSDYTRIRYASCGNIKFFLLSDNAFALKSSTQTYHNFMTNEYGKDKAQPRDSKNLLQYLGKNSHINPYVSGKKELPEESTMLFVSGNVWERVDDIEILDAYQTYKPDELLGNFEDLFLHSQIIMPPVRSYAVVTAFVEKTYKEDTIKKKKRRRRIIIFSIIAVIIAIILTIIILSFRASDRRTLNEIDRLSEAGARYSVLGNFTMAHEQLGQANTLVLGLRNNWQFRREKRELTDEVLDRWNLLDRIVRGDRYLEEGNLINAQRLFQEAYNMAWAHHDLMIAQPLNQRRWRVEMLISADDLVQVAEMYEIEGMFREALALLLEAEDIARDLLDLPLRREMMGRVFEINRIINNLVEVDFIQHIQALMLRAEDDLNFVLALQYSEFIINVYDDLGIASSQALADRARIIRNIELDVVAEDYNRRAIQAIAGERFADAVNYYEMALLVYAEMGISVGNLRYRNVINEILRLENLMAEIAEEEAAAQENNSSDD